jgi:hypothetical protein
MLLKLKKYNLQIIFSFFKLEELFFKIIKINKNLKNSVFTVINKKILEIIKIHKFLKIDESLAFSVFMGLNKNIFKDCSELVINEILTGYSYLCAIHHNIYDSFIIDNSKFAFDGKFKLCKFALLYPHINKSIKLTLGVKLDLYYNEIHNNPFIESLTLKIKDSGESYFIEKVKILSQNLNLSNLYFEIEKTSSNVFTPHLFDFLYIAYKRKEDLKITIKVEFIQIFDLLGTKLILFSFTNNQTFRNHKNVISLIISSMLSKNDILVKELIDKLQELPFLKLIYRKP